VTHVTGPKSATERKALARLVKSQKKDGFPVWPSQERASGVSEERPAAQGTETVHRKGEGRSIAKGGGPPHDGEKMEKKGERL